MTTGKAFGQLWSHGARDWASLVEPHYRPLYEAVHERLGIRSDVRLLDVGCGPGGSAQLAAGRGGQVRLRRIARTRSRWLASEIQRGIFGSAIWKAFPSPMVVRFGAIACPSGRGEGRQKTDSSICSGKIRE